MRTKPQQGAVSGNTSGEQAGRGGDCAHGGADAGEPARHGKEKIGTAPGRGPHGGEQGRLAPWTLGAGAPLLLAHGSAAPHFGERAGAQHDGAIYHDVGEAFGEVVRVFEGRGVVHFGEIEDD